MCAGGDGWKGIGEVYVTPIYYYIFLPSPMFSVQYKLKVVRELTWIVLRFSFRDMF